MAEGRLAGLYGAFLDLALEPDAARTFPTDPAGFAAARGLPGRDQASLRRFAPRLEVYRQLVRTTLADPLDDCFPITIALLQQEDAWRECRDAFLASRTVASPYYRDINPAFVQWLAESRWGAERWPFLLALAHWEYVELEVLRCRDETRPADLSAEPDGRAAFDPSVRLLRYDWRVQEADTEAPVPESGEVHLLAYRDADLDFAWRELGPAGAAFLVRLQQGQPLDEAFAGLDLDRAEALALLAELLQDGAILGFH